MAITTNIPRPIAGDAFDFDDPLSPDYTATITNRREQAERDQRWCEAQQGVIDAMVNGTVPYAAPWEDKRFQKLVIKALANGGSWRREAEKLAVIREVFGSKS